MGIYHKNTNSRAGVGATASASGQPALQYIQVPVPDWYIPLASTLVGHQFFLSSLLFPSRVQPLYTFLGWTLYFQGNMHPEHAEIQNEIKLTLTLEERVW